MHSIMLCALGRTYGFLKGGLRVLDAWEWSRIRSMHVKHATRLLSWNQTNALATDVREQEGGPVRNLRGQIESEGARWGLLTVEGFE
jgi:hypothetical protein